MISRLIQNKFILLTIALLAFAGNSVLCRLALSDNSIDPTSFTTFRIVSGALFLYILLGLSHGWSISIKARQWVSAAALFLYAAGFSFAYQYLETGTGALILFAAVQLTLVGFSIHSGKQPSALEWSGMAMAFLGLVVLLLPNLSTPTVHGALLMALAGIAWAVYTLRGKSSNAPSLENRRNFILAIPMSLALYFGMTLFEPNSIHVSNNGIWLAITSGALASGAGYAIWYMALKHISVLQAGVLQLSVPLIAAVGGLIWADELITMSFVFSATLILSGIYVILAKAKKS